MPLTRASYATRTERLEAQVVKRAHALVRDGEAEATLDRWLNPTRPLPMNVGEHIWLYHLLHAAGYKLVDVR